MLRALVFINVGGENGDPLRRYDYYSICNGEEHRALAEDWASQIGINKERVTERDGVFYCDGRRLTITILPDDNGYDDWQELHWQSR